MDTDEKSKKRAIQIHHWWKTLHALVSDDEKWETIDMQTTIGHVKFMAKMLAGPNGHEFEESFLGYLATFTTLASASSTLFTANFIPITIELCDFCLKIADGSFRREFTGHFLDHWQKILANISLDLKFSAFQAGHFEYCVQLMNKCDSVSLQRKLLNVLLAYTEHAYKSQRSRLVGGWFEKLLIGKDYRKDLVELFTVDIPREMHRQNVSEVRWLKENFLRVFNLRMPLIVIAEVWMAAQIGRTIFRRDAIHQNLFFFANKLAKSFEFWVWTEDTELNVVIDAENVKSVRVTMDPGPFTTYITFTLKSPPKFSSESGDIFHPENLQANRVSFQFEPGFLIRKFQPLLLEMCGFEAAVRTSDREDDPDIQIIEQPDEAKEQSFDSCVKIEEDSKKTPLEVQSPDLIDYPTSSSTLYNKKSRQQSIKPWRQKGKKAKEASPKTAEKSAEKSAISDAAHLNATTPKPTVSDANEAHIQPIIEKDDIPVPVIEEKREPVARAIPVAAVEPVFATPKAKPRSSVDKLIEGSKVLVSPPRRRATRQSALNASKKIKSISCKKSDQFDIALDQRDDMKPRKRVAKTTSSIKSKQEKMESKDPLVDLTNKPLRKQGAKRLYTHNELLMLDDELIQENDAPKERRMVAVPSGSLTPSSFNSQGNITSSQHITNNMSKINETAKSMTKLNTNVSYSYRAAFAKTKPTAYEPDSTVTEVNIDMDIESCPAPVANGNQQQCNCHEKHKVIVDGLNVIAITVNQMKEVLNSNDNE